MFRHADEVDDFVCNLWNEVNLVEVELVFHEWMGRAECVSEHGGGCTILLNPKLTRFSRTPSMLWTGALAKCSMTLLSRAPWIANFGQRAQHRFYEACVIHLSSLRKNRDLVFPCAIEENREHSFLMEM
jgi:hypothetical protein